MPTPIPTQIIDEIQNRLANITQANGYTTTLKNVDRAKTGVWKGEEVPAANVWDSVEERTGEGGGFQLYQLTVFIELYDKTRDEPFVDLAAKLSTDVQVAMNRSVGSPLVADQPSLALGGLVTRVALTTSTPIIGSGQKPFCGALLEYAVTYRRKPEDPFSIYP